MPKAIISKAKVLIVDDEPSNVRLLERVLEMNEAGQIISTTDARKALGLFLEFDPDLVLLDLNMPHLDGFAVMAQLQEAVPSDCYLPILVLTADITPETKRRALAAGAKDFLTKPLDNSEVVLRIKNLLENRFLHLEMQQQVRDRTARLEEALEKLNSTQEHIVKQERLRALGMMAGGVAHDFNNALTMMLGYGELLLPWLQERAGAREIGYLHNMISAAQDATHVVARLRDFYRPAEANEIRAAVDLSQLADAAISLTAPRWKGGRRAEGIQIDLQSDLAEVPPISGNAAELREVLTNLIFNAVDAMPDGGVIRVITSHTDGEVTIAVSDSGVGMTETERARCLEPFFTTKGEHGTGLGLSVVYGIVQRHGGTIDISSQKGCGTTFLIKLPVTLIPAASSPQLFPCVIGRALRILVVDDQEIIAELVAEHLKADGHATTTAVDSSEALEVFRQGYFDVVITDQSMPGMNGMQLAAAMKESAPETPVILLSGFGEEMLEGENAGSVDLLLGKPVSAADLRRALFQVTSLVPEIHAAA